MASVAEAQLGSALGAAQPQLGSGLSRLLGGLAKPNLATIV